MGAMLLRGRDGLVDDIVSALTATDIRAVTLHGPSGVGKTRLAASAAWRLSSPARERASSRSPQTPSPCSTSRRHGCARSRARAASCS
jgi:hypothetical protein